MRILHLTDLHLSGNEPARLPEQLATLIGSVNFVVVSGDLTRTGAANEYELAHDYLHHLRKLVPGRELRRVVVVPGDLDLCTQGNRQALDAAVSIGKINGAAPLGAFQQFIEQFYENAFTDESKRFALNEPDAGLHWSCHLFKKEQIAFYGFNSCDRHESTRTGPGINDGALKAALAHKKNHADKFCCVAVWHHGLTCEPGLADRISWKTIAELERHGFHVGIHGHTHEDEFFALRGLAFQPLRWIPALPLIATGSLGTEWDERDKGVWNQASIIEITSDDVVWKLFQLERNTWEEQPAHKYSRGRRSDSGPPDSRRVHSSRHRRVVRVDLDGIARIEVELKDLSANRPVLLAAARAAQLIVDEQAKCCNINGEQTGTIEVQDGTASEGRRELRLPPPNSETSVPLVSWGYTIANALALTNLDCSMQQGRRALAFLKPNEDAIVHQVTFATDELELVLELPFAPTGYRAIEQYRDAEDRWQTDDRSGRECRRPEALPPSRDAQGRPGPLRWRLSLVVPQPQINRRYALTFSPPGATLEPLCPVNLEDFIRHCYEEMQEDGGQVPIVTQAMDADIRDYLTKPGGARPTGAWVVHLWHPQQRRLIACFGPCPQSHKSTIFAYGEGIAGHAFRRAGPAVYYAQGGASGTAFPRTVLYRERRDVLHRNAPDYRWVVSIPLMTLGEAPQPVGVLSFSSHDNNAWSRLSQLARVNSTNEKPSSGAADVLTDLIKLASSSFWHALAQLPKDPYEIMPVTEGWSRSLTKPQQPLASVTQSAEPKRGRTFISYYGGDRAVVRTLAEELAKRGIDTWFDEKDIAPGTFFGDKINRDIEDESAAFIAVISRQVFKVKRAYFLREWWCAHGVQSSFSGDSAFVFPIIVDDLSRSEAVEELRTYFKSWADLHVECCPGGRVTEELVAALRQAHQRFAEPRPQPCP